MGGRMKSFLAPLSWGGKGNRGVGFKNAKRRGGGFEKMGKESRTSAGIERP